MSKNESLDTFHECDITKRKGYDEFYFVYINRSEKNQIITFKERIIFYIIIKYFTDKLRVM